MLVVSVSYHFYRQYYYSRIPHLRNHFLEISLKQFLFNESFPIFVTPVSCQFYGETCSKHIHHLRNHFLKVSPNKFLLQWDLSCVSAKSFFSIFLTILLQWHPAFKKPLVKNESKPISDTMRPFLCYLLQFLINFSDNPTTARSCI